MILRIARSYSFRRASISLEPSFLKFLPQNITRFQPFSSSMGADSPSSDAARSESAISTSETNATQVSVSKNPIVQMLWTAREEAKARALSNSIDDSDPNAGRTPQASRVEVSYNFSQDPLLMETYRNPWGNLRKGKLMEDLDALAGNVAFFHVVADGKEHPLIVTASVDRIRFKRKKEIAKGKGMLDQHLSGQVTWTGSSSMEIRMQCRDLDDTGEEWLEAYTTFVTLDPKTKRPIPIPQLQPQTAEERALFDAGAARAALRKQRRQNQNDDAPSASLNKLAKSLLDQAAPLLRMPTLADPHACLQSQTVLQNALIAHPQVRNLHHRIFGGYLMRVAYELAYANAYLFGGVRPRFVEVDEVRFTKEVNIGDLLVFSSKILYTQEMPPVQKDGNTYATTHLHVQVEAWVTEPEQIKATSANQFYYTMEVKREISGGAEGNDHRQVRAVLPANWDEALQAATRILADKAQSRT